MSMNLKILVKKTPLLVQSVVVLMLSVSGPVSALTAEQKRVIDSGAYYFDVEVAPAACTTILPGNDNPQRIWNSLVEKGLSAPQIAGILGNIQSESAGTFDPRVVEFGFPNSDGVISKAGDPATWDDEVPPNAKPNGQPGYGIVQWTSPNRKQGLKDLAIDRGTIGGDLGTQMEFLWGELNSSYKSSTLDPILATDSYIEATDIFLENFESPAHIERTRPVRRTQALNWLNTFGSQTTPADQGSSTPTLSCGANQAIELDEAGCPTGPIPESETVLAAGIRVHPCIAKEVERVVNLANQNGLDMSGYGWRDTQRQEELRVEHGCGGSLIYDGSCKGSPPTAVPGRSRHERGIAVDFTCSGTTIGSRNHPCFTFLSENTSLKNLPSEPWHWSIDGH